MIMAPGLPMGPASSGPLTLTSTWGRSMDMSCERIDRRSFCKVVTGTVAAGVRAAWPQASGPKFRLRYILASSLYGRLPLEQVVAQAPKTGAEHIDIWPEGHANHREQIEEIGLARFAAMLRRHRVKLGALTHFDLGPYALGPEMRVAEELGGSLIVCGAAGPRQLHGPPLKAAVGEFVEKMKPHVATAESRGIVIGIENHANSLIESPDSIRWFAELAPSAHLGIALAPYHLAQDAERIAGLIADLGDRLVHFYAWQHGMGCHQKLPKQQELLQMPGRGELDFAPILSALKRIGYKGWTEIFMHPVPRGIPIRPTAAEVTGEINRAREYLETCVTKIPSPVG